MCGFGFNEVVLGLSLALLMGSGDIAFAAGIDRTEDDLVRQGVEARRRQDDAGALELFAKAYKLHASPRSAAQMGLAEIALGSWLEAETHLEEALAAGSDPWIRKNHKVLDESLARVLREVGRLDVLGGPAGAEIVIGGEVKGSLPLSTPIHVRTGEVRFELRAPGFQADVRTVHVIAGQLARETIRLAPLAPPSPAIAKATTDASTVHTLAGNSSAPGTLPLAADEGRPGLRTLGIVVAGAGFLAAAVGLTFGLKARAAGRDGSNDPVFSQAADASGHRYQTWQWIGYGVGVGLLGVGATTYLIGSKRTASASEEARLSISWIPTQSGGLAYIGGRL
jgi:hypothetical protein